MAKYGKRIGVKDLTDDDLKMLYRDTQGGIRYIRADEQEGWEDDYGDGSVRSYYGDFYEGKRDYGGGDDMKLSWLYGRLGGSPFEEGTRALFGDIGQEYIRRQSAAAAPKPAPKPAPPPTPKVDKVEQTYMKQIKTLEDQIKQIQKTPPKPTLPPPKPPTTPYSVGSTPISLSNPYQRKTMGGIGQFKSRTSQGMATIKSGLVNI